MAADQTLDGFSTINWVPCSSRTGRARSGIVEAFLKGRSIEKEEDVYTLVTEIEGDFQAVKQTMVNQGVVIDVPISSVSTAVKVDADIEAWAAKK